MEIYLVGGAVRDELLGRPVRERDWVVVGADADELLAEGYRQVGRDFPVFLHPRTGEQYALARTERKTAPGHRGFAVHADAGVPLEADLARRDLTINAIAKNAAGRLLDPHGGQQDLAKRVLRHVGAAFSEDPLRVFRAARFAAELVDFTIHETTVELMSSMADSLGELPAERVWAEFRKALAAPQPQRFVDTLTACGCLGCWFPELAGASLDTRANSARGRYGALGCTLGEKPVRRLSARLKVPNDFADLAEQVARHGEVLARWREAEPRRLIAAAKAMGTFQKLARSQRVFELVGVLAGTSLDELERLLGRVAAETDAGALQSEGLSGPALGQRISQERAARLAMLRGQLSG